MNITPINVNQRVCQNKTNNKQSFKAAQVRIGKLNWGGMEDDSPKYVKSFIGFLGELITHPKLQKAMNKAPNDSEIYARVTNFNPSAFWIDASKISDEDSQMSMVAPYCMDDAEKAGALEDLANLFSAKLQKLTTPDIKS